MHCRRLPVIAQITLTLLVIPAFIRMLYVMTMHPVLGRVVQSIFLLVVDLLTFLAVFCCNWVCFAIVFHQRYFDNPNEDVYAVRHL